MKLAPYAMDVERYLAGAMSPRETEAFLRRTQDAPESTTYLAGALQQQALLIELLSDAVARQARGSDATSRGPSARRPSAPAPRRARVPQLVRPWPWWLTGIAAAVLVALGVLLNRQWRLRMLPAPVTMAVAEQAHGPVTLLRDGSEMPLAPGQPVRHGDAVRAGAAAARALIRYTDQTALAVAPDTFVEFRRPNVSGAKDVFLRYGRLQADVRLQPASAPMRLETPHAELTVRGTRFVLCAYSASTAVDVESGTLDLRNRRSRETATLHARDYALVADTTHVAQGAGMDALGRMTAGSARVREGLVALYTFNEGGGHIVGDHSGAGAPVDLRIRDASAVEWLPEGGLRVREPTLIESDGSPEKIVGACRRSNALSVEAWIRTWQLRQGGPARIVTVSKDWSGADFMLGAIGLSYNPDLPGPCYAARLTTAAKRPALYEIVTEPGTFTTALSHVVLVRESHGALRFHVNGPDRLRGMLDYEAGTVRADVRRQEGRFSYWSDTMPLRLANEHGEPRPWVGEYYLVAVYARALAPEEISRNFRAGTPRRSAGAARRDVVEISTLDPR
ncbi:MAG: FecR domain-containing protein [Kiritimatiellae bacterium]|nr:FecR domain-containing protein [Kiritimatiellia bacterium]